MTEQEQLEQIVKEIRLLQEEISKEKLNTAKYMMESDLHRLYAALGKIVYPLLDQPIF